MKPYGLNLVMHFQQPMRVLYFSIPTVAPPKFVYAIGSREDGCGCDEMGISVTFDSSGSGFESSDRPFIKFHVVKTTKNIC